MSIHHYLQRWARDILRFLPIKTSFVLHGNIHDIFPYPCADAEPVYYIPHPLEMYLTETLKASGYSRFIAYDPIDGFILSSADDLDYFRSLTELNFEVRRGIAFGKASLLKAMDVMDTLANVKDQFLAIFVRFASRLSLNPESLNQEEQEFFTRALKLAYEAQPHMSPGDNLPRMNPVFWLCEKLNDLPSWLTVDNPKLRVVNIPRPDAHIRRQIISAVSPSFYGFDNISEEKARQQFTENFVDLTDSMLVHDIIAICQLSIREKVEFKDISDAVRRYKLGVTENPWHRINRDKIENGEMLLAERVKGQQPAIVKAMDILKRAVTGLAGIQHSKISNKPKGVLFFAGPTGVGKTELAKALTELIFGDENAYIRFDMSEFSQPHADQRLLGAPPGYVGYEAGGELTKAVREKPFSVMLFDEIEKAHPRILDKFLQILEDGRITDGRGETVYFSETIIIFTSNLGVRSVDLMRAKETGANPEVPSYDELRSNLLAAIEHYFKVELSRPEILNRIGDNVVVFDYIRPEIAGQIFDKIWRNLVTRLTEVNKINLEIHPDALAQLKQLCTEDLANGGRGIGNRFESHCINPLSRALFDIRCEEDQHVTISEIQLHDRIPCIVLG